MSAPRDPSGQEPTWQGTSTPPAGEPVFKTKLSYVDVKRTTRKAPRRASPQQTRGQRWRRTVVVFIAEMAAVAAFFFGVLAWYDFAGIQKQGNAPLAALQQFCGYEARQDYGDAYGMVSNVYAHSLSEHDFEAVNNARDQQYGTVTGCSQIQRDLFGAFGPVHAAFSLTVTTTRGTYHGTAMLALEQKPLPDSPDQSHNVWTIDDVSPEAHLDQ